MVEWQRTARGQFGPGNTGGPGNKLGGLVARFRIALLQAVTPEDVTDLGRSLLKQAKAGDMDATRLLLRYLVGDPAKMPSPDEAEVDEYRRERELRKLRRIARLDEMDDR